jgi:hypothetical protein
LYTTVSSFTGRERGKHAAPSDALRVCFRLQGGAGSEQPMRAGVGPVGVRDALRPGGKPEGARCCCNAIRIAAGPPWKAGCAKIVRQQTPMPLCVIIGCGVWSAEVRATGKKRCLT